jgi:DNA-binding GntR family transcriptional regulator
MGNPMYRQIAEDLREQIESEQLAPGAQLPTELELRERYGASRNTIRDAIRWLMNLEADFFKLPPDGRVSVFENFRTAFDQTGQPIRATVTVFPTDRNQFVVEIGNVPEL